MKGLSAEIGIVLIALLFLASPAAFANGEGVKHAHEAEEEGLELGVLSGLITFICVISTVVVGRMMKKGKVKVTTHHTLAYITVLVALFHGIYNLITH